MSDRRVESATRPNPRIDDHGSETRCRRSATRFQGMSGHDIADQRPVACVREGECMFAIAFMLVGGDGACENVFVLVFSCAGCKRLAALKRLLPCLSASSDCSHKVCYVSMAPFLNFVLEIPRMAHQSTPVEKAFPFRNFT